MLAATAVVFYLFAVFGETKPAALTHQKPEVVEHESGNGKAPSGLAELALQKVLSDAAPIFGGDKVSSDSATANWMKQYPDDTKLVHMNIPGTHDAATWNYSQATQEALEPITNLNGITEIDPDNFRCHDESLLTSLNAGIRAFDLRYASDVTNSSLVFWHGIGLQSQTATLDSVLFSFYAWLDKHPDEALFLSFQWEGNAIPNNDNTENVQALLHAALTSPAAKQYILQTNTLSTLGSARGKITLLRRFDLNLLPASQTTSLPGLHFSPNDWTVNGRNITLSYNSDHATAHIQDYYSPQTPSGAPAKENIQAKFNATTSFFNYAASDAAPDELFWSFASSTKTGDEPPSTPRIQALGNGTELTPEGGVNNRLVEYLKSMQGKRLGIVMFDFYEQPEGLLETFLGLTPPPEK
ncbi:hypothetical protein Q7P37_006584 [Cladosporium fusiforme]